MDERDPPGLGYDLGPDAGLEVDRLACLGSDDDELAVYVGLREECASGGVFAAVGERQGDEVDPSADPDGGGCEFVWRRVPCRRWSGLGHDPSCELDRGR